MSALITDKLVTPCGNTTTAAAGGYLDAAGNVFGSPGFLPNYVIDYAGNLGTIPSVTTDCTLIATIIGSAIPPGEWEMQSGTSETVGANGGTISSNYTANTAAPLLHSFVSMNATGYLTGVVAGTGTWTIKAGPEAIAGTGYIGSGLLVATGANTHTGPIVMEVGTKLQLGADCSNTVTRSRGNLTLNEGAVVTQFTSFPNATYLTQALTNNGTYNIKGCGTCGVGGINYSSTVANTGVINIDDAAWKPVTSWTGTGTINVKDGGTLSTSATSQGGTNRVNINGCGWCDASGVQIGAINVASTGTFTARVNVQTPSCIKANFNQNTEFSGLLTGSAALTVSSLYATKPNAIQSFTNTGNTYSGTMTVDGTSISQSTGNSLQYAKIVLANGGRIGTNVNSSQVIGSLASTDPTTYWASGDFTVNTIKANGITTYAGRLLWNGGSNTSNIFFNGGPENELTLTGTGNTATVYPRNGARLILQGATFIGTQGQVRAQTGATVSAGTSTTASVSYLYIDGTSKLEVKAVGAGTSLITATLGFVPSTGWKVDAVDALAAGTYPILKYSGTATTILPTIGINNTGRTVTFAYNNAVNPKVLNMIVT
jgi:hypothetical protein